MYHMNSCKNNCKMKENICYIHHIIFQQALVEKLPANPGDVRDVGLIPWSRISSGGGNGNPLQ